MAQNWVVYCFMYWDLMVYYFMYWHSVWRSLLRSTTARAHLPRQVPECGWATHSAHEPHRRHGSSLVVFGDAGGVTPPEVISIHRAASHPLGPSHGPMWRTEVPIYNSHNGEGMQTEQGHLQRHTPGALCFPLWLCQRPCSRSAFREFCW